MAGKVIAAHFTTPVRITVYGRRHWAMAIIDRHGTTLPTPAGIKTLQYFSISCRQGLYIGMVAATAAADSKCEPCDHIGYSGLSKGRKLTVYLGPIYQLTLH